MEKIISILKDERGQGMAEYGLILALIAIVAIIALTALGGKIKEKFEAVTSGMDQGGSSGTGGSTP